MQPRQRKKTIKLTAASWKRIVALMADYLILSTFVLFPFNNLMENYIGAESFQDIMNLVSNQGSILPLIYIAVLMSIMTVIYFVVLEYKFSQTIGKIIMRIEVESAGKELSLQQSIIRSLSMFFLFTIPVLVIIDAAYVYFNKEGQRFFEKLSQTRTIMTAQI